MKQKLLDLLEKHVDKLMLAIVAIASLAILWFFVISNPYAKDIGGGVSAGPGKIDTIIKQDAERLKNRIKGEATEPYRKYDGNKEGQYLAMMKQTVEVNDQVGLSIPGSGIAQLEDKRFYRKPSIPDVTEADAEVIRTAVFFPTEKVDFTMPYQVVPTEVKDIDFVTVQVSFDVPELYRNFRNSFGSGADPDYRDDELAVPIFAAVGVERQVLGENGKWSDWEKVKRPRIDKRREMFVVPEKAEDIDLGGIDVLLMNFRDFEVQKDLLQPIAYEVAASNEEWMTPVYHKEMAELLEKEYESVERLPGGGRIRPGAGGAGAAYMGGEMGMYPGPGAGAGGTRGVRTRSGRTPSTRTGDGRTIEKIREDFEFLKLTKDLDMSIMKEPLVLWAFDDDVKPHRSYRYRIRLGVFNPTAGKGWFSGSDAVFKDDVILWSNYSDVTAAIKIDPMLHIFPLEVVKGKKDTANIQVSKFHDGKWRSQEFEVQVGESIGKLVEVEPEENSAVKRPRSKVAEDIKTINFDSGAILVDIVESKRSHSVGRPYQEILYTQNGGDIDHLGISTRNWSKALSSVFKDIEAQKDIYVQIYENRGMGGGRGMYPGMGPGGEYGEFGDPMMEGFGEF